MLAYWILLYFYNLHACSYELVLDTRIILRKNYIEICHQSSVQNFTRDRLLFSQVYAAYRFTKEHRHLPFYLDTKVMMAGQDFLKRYSITP